LKRLSRSRGLSTPDFLESLARRAEDDQLLDEHEAALAQLMADPKQTASYRSELSAWDGTLQDGLQDLELSAPHQPAKLISGPYGPSFAATGTPVSDDDVRRTLEVVRERR
jgi:hypothetical protein